MSHNFSEAVVFLILSVVRVMRSASIGFYTFCRPWASDSAAIRNRNLHILPQTASNQLARC